MDYFDRKLWMQCKICGYKCVAGNGRYFRQDFVEHLKTSHNIDLNIYFKDVCGMIPPKCPCGICDKPLLINSKASANFRYNLWACGRNDGVMKWSEEAKTTRKGSGNPMFDKTPWNDGLTKDTSDSVMQVSLKMTGRITSDEAKKKQSDSAKKRLIHGHTGCKHTDETKQLFREITLKRMAEGKFKQTKTKPHIEVERILQELGLVYESEKVIGCWSFDIYIPELDFYIEVDGDYFHSNPKFYPNGPKTKTQKINWYRDIKKNKFCEENNLKLARFWECDIINNPEYIKEEICKLKK